MSAARPLTGDGAPVELWLLRLALPLRVRHDGLWASAALCPPADSGQQGG